jgi:hypothetical protein
MGNAWRFPIPLAYRQEIIAQNNSLEIVASFISVWIAIERNNIAKKNVLLSTSG